VPLAGRGGAAAALVARDNGPKALVVMGGGVASSGRMIGENCCMTEHVVGVMLLVDFDFLHFTLVVVSPRRRWTW
jgi:hypothetical protein